MSAARHRKCAEVIVTLGALFLTSISTPVIADDEIEPAYLFQSQYYRRGFYTTAKEACEAAMPESPAYIVYSNPRGFANSQYGVGCAYRLERTRYGLSEVTDPWFGQGWMRIVRVCPAEYQFDSVTQKCRANKPHIDDVCPVGNPITPAMGTKQQNETDFRLPNSQVPLQVVRYYTSRATEPTLHYGQGWVLNPYSMRLAYFEALDRVSVYRAPDERWDFFLDSGIYRRVGAHGITANRVSTDQGERWIITGGTYDQEIYHLDGYLLELKKGRNWNRLQYSDATTLPSIAPKPGLLTRVADEAGRAIDFMYNDGAMLTEIRFAGEPLITYQYSDESAVGKRKLTSVMRTSGAQRHYQYMPEPSRVEVALSAEELSALTFVGGVSGDDAVRVLESGGGGWQRLLRTGNSITPLIAISDENGALYARWSYDDQGRAVSSEHAGGTDRTTLAYNEDGSTTVTNALGKQSRYHFTVINGSYKVTQVEGSATPYCAARSRSLSYDANGFVDMQTDWNGTVTDFDHNARGLEIRRVEAVGTLEARTIVTEWHPTLPLKTRVIEPGLQTVYTYDDGGRLTSTTMNPLPAQQ